MTTLKQAYARLNAARDLDELVALMNKIDAELDPDDRKNLDMSELPMFSGPAPDNTDGVWSWDKTRRIVGDCAPFRIEPRPDNKE